jgi:hypothetical protein
MKTQDQIITRIKELTQLRSVKQAKLWWNSLSDNERMIAGAVLTAAIASPFIVSAISKLTVTKMTMVGVNSSGTQALFLAEKVAAPFWHKVFAGLLTGSMWAGMGALVASAVKFSTEVAMGE